MYTLFINNRTQRGTQKREFKSLELALLFITQFIAEHQDDTMCLIDTKLFYGAQLIFTFSYLPNANASYFS